VSFLNVKILTKLKNGIQNILVSIQTNREPSLNGVRPTMKLKRDLQPGALLKRTQNILMLLKKSL